MAKNTLKQSEKLFIESENNKLNLPIIIIGAGPIGMAAAAHLVDQEEEFIILESGAQIGSNIGEWAHVRLFSPWKFNIDKVASKLLSAQGWETPDPDEVPTGQELLARYLKPLSLLPSISSRLRLNSKVIAVSKKDTDKMKSAGRDELPFEVYVDVQGAVERYEAKAVIDASGTWGNFNPLYASGVWTSEEKSLSDKIFYGIPDIKETRRDDFIGKRIAVIGGGHSAINTVLDLATLKEIEPKTEIVWILRKHRVEDTYGGQENDQLAARGELGIRIRQLVESKQVEVVTPFRIQKINSLRDTMTLTGLHDHEEKEISGIHTIIVNAGSRPDFSFLRELRLSIDPAIESVDALAPLIDPNIHSCGTVRPHGEKELRQLEKGFYIVGMKSYGRAPTFLLATGYEQVRSVVAYLKGNFEAAMKVELELPETGVCSLSQSSIKSSESCPDPIEKSKNETCCN